jgi:adenylate cyclase
MKLAPSAIRRCFEGAVPAVIATCAPDGTPNLAYLSQVHYVDDRHVALTFQFFNNPRRHILAHPRATVQVVDPETAAHFRLHLRYLRTETEGPLFEHMKAKLAGIASHTGMSKVFHLLGSDIYEVLDVEHVFGTAPDPGTSRPDLLPRLRACLADLGACGDLAHLFDETLDALERHCDIGYSMLLMHDPAHQRLYTVASRGYAQSGVGWEVHVGDGIIGVAGRERTPIRIGYTAQAYVYGRAMREGFAHSPDAGALENEIPFPGLPDPGSQLAVPLKLGDRLLGVMYVESREARRFTYEDEDALVILAGQLALAIELLAHSAELHEELPSKVPAAPVQGLPMEVRHFAADHSVFVGPEYLIKGVAGAILWKLLRDYVHHGRSEFTNRELRLDRSLGLPDISDNLEARLILLQRRLAERCPCLAITRTGRGRFRLEVARPLQLAEVPAG